MRTVRDWDKNIEKGPSCAGAPLTKDSWRKAKRNGGPVGLVVPHPSSCFDPRSRPQGCDRYSGMGAWRR